MEAPRRKLLVILSIGALLILIGVFSSSWVSGKSTDGGSTAKAALSGGTSCAGGQCQSVKLGSFDENWGLVGVAGIIAGLASVGTAIYAAFLLFRRREAKLDPKKLALPAGVGAASVVIFLFIKPPAIESIPIGISYGGFVALAGYALVAGAIFLTSVWIVPQPWAQPGAYAPPQGPVGGYQAPNAGYVQQPQGYPMQPQPMQPMPMQIQPMQPHGYSPQTQPAQGYAPPQQPVQPIQPVPPMMQRQPMMPGQPMHDPRAPAPPMAPLQHGAPGSQPPVAMMQKQSTTIPPGTNPCPRCSTGLAYSSTHGKWYCARCQQYV